MANVLIFGGAGFFGRNLAAEAKKRGHIVSIVDTKPLPDWVGGDFWYTRADIRYIGVFSEITDQFIREADIIVNCAAQTSHPKSMESPGYDAHVNCVGSAVLLERVLEHNPDAIVVFTSSSTVVGPSPRVVSEWSDENPIDIYSANKLAAERYYRIFNQVNELKTIVLRFPNLFGRYGIPDPAYGFVNFFINQARNGSLISVYGHGDQERNVLYVKDAVDAIFSAIDTDELHNGEPVFVAGDEHLPIIKIAEIISDWYGSEFRQVDWPEQRRKIEVGNVRIDGSYFRVLAEWRPGYTLESGLRDMSGAKWKR